MLSENQRLLMLGILMASILAFIPAVRADIINPDYKNIDTENRITNINDFPDYWFIAAQDNEGGVAPCKIQIISENGIIPSDYKFCMQAVYAIPNSISKNNLPNEENIKEFLSRPEVKKVITDIEIQASVPISSTIDSKKNEYAIVLDERKNKPDSEGVERNFLVYVYLGIILLGVIGLVTYLVKRKNAK